RWRMAWMIGALFCATALLLFKQSGFLLLGVAFLLPLASWRPNETKWKQLALSLVLVAIVIVGAQSLANAILPHEFEATKQRFNSNWVMSPHELMALPKAVWGANLQLVSAYIGADYSWFVALFFVAGIWFAVRRRHLAELTLILMCLAGAIGVIFLLRGFNEYLFNTAIIVVLLPLIARVGLVIWELPRVGRVRIVRGGLLAGAAIMLALWSYQIVLIGVSPGRFIELSTPWAASNYLTGWPTGFGVKEVMTLLEKEKQPGIIFADAQWGNPRSALEVYQARFPNLRIIPISREFSEPATVRKFAELAKKNRPVHFAIFSADPSGGRRDRQANVEREMCAERTEVKAYPGQMPIIVCRF
ncbi:MAG: hypothetical protein M3Y03_01555, partial [Verrucomicrobiota bacterium]|nr:hypothetical protein [Verrucomicrobiota bacterium]